MLFLRPFCPILGAQKKDFAFLEDAMREKLLVVGAADMNLTLPVRALPPAGGKRDRGTEKRMRFFEKKRAKNFA